jgi:prepilin-type N-terminal cleavage/methylation domain-containing protein
MTPQRPNRTGFTLVEVLIVITILGMLMALTVVGIAKALDTARQARITTDLSQLDAALVTYKTDRNDFPPALFGVPGQNFNGTVIAAAQYDQVRFNRHIRQAFPRYRGGDPYTTFGEYVRYLNAGDAPNNIPPLTPPLNIYDLDPAESLVLWLGGISDQNASIGRLSGTRKLIGFSADPARPFSTTQPKPPIYDFDPQRLVDRDGDGWLEYAVDFRADKADMPGYVYFDYRGYTRDTNSDGVPDAISTYSPTAAHGFAMPYATAVRTTANNVNTIKWSNAQKFQLIAAGLDGVFSDQPVTVPTVDTAERIFPTGLNYTEGDDDNLVNFTTSTLRTEMEKQ